MAFLVDFIGLVNFFREDPPLQPNQRLVLLPNGQNAAPIEPHFASFIVESNKVVNNTTNWPEENDPLLKVMGLRKFPINNPSIISISGVETANGAGGLNTQQHDGKLPRLHDQDPLFRIVPGKADAIAQIAIRSGVLEARMFAKSIVTRLTATSHSGNVIITARPNGAPLPDRTLTVKDGTEIVLCNISKLLKPVAPDPATMHFHIYSRLEVDRRDALREPKPEELAKVPPLPLSHPFLQMLASTSSTFGQFPGEQCSNSGCCP